MGITYSYAQSIATFQVELNQTNNYLDLPVSIELDSVTSLPDSLLDLLEIQDEKKVSIPFQIHKNGSRRMHWIIKPGNTEKTKYAFGLIKGITTKSEQIEAKINDGVLAIRTGSKNLLNYNFKTVYPPDGVDTTYKRSAFIHPLWSPHGQVLTQIQPPDHYHHYGIWNPWTHVLFEGDTVDFWNLAKKQGTVRFAGFESITNGSIFSEFKAHHEHIVFKENGLEKVALNELQSIRVYRPGENQNYYIVDIEIQFKNDTKNPVLLLEYRYGGLGWRATEQWNKDNSEVLTSAGKTRKESDGSKARWCIIQGKLDDDYGGIVMMSHPANFNHPEPLRIWPEDQNGRGDVFVNFSPTKDKDWLLEAGRTYFLKYRLLVFNNHITKDLAENAWQYFVNTPKVMIHLGD